jgi:hypothetical protein
MGLYSGLAISFLNKMRLKYFLVIGIELFGCTKRDNASMSLEDSINSKPVYSALTLDEYGEFYNSDSTVANSDILKELTIDFDCAVFIYPTEEQIDEMIKTYGEEDFYIIADDNNWYQSMAIEMLDSVGIKKATVHGDSLRFEGEDRTWGFDLKRDSLFGWNIILFNRKKEPQVISTADLTTKEIRDYFEIEE